MAGERRAWLRGRFRGAVLQEVSRLLMGNAPMKKSPFKSDHKSRKVTCEKCGGTYDRVFYEKVHKGICNGES